MKVIKITRKTKHKTDQMELVISILCLVEGIKLSKTDIKVLAFFVVHGLKESTEQLLVNSGIVKDIPQLRNIKTKLTNLKFLKKEPNIYKSYELNMNKDFVNDSELNIIITIDNN